LLELGQKCLGRQPQVPFLHESKGELGRGDVSAFEGPGRGRGEPSSTNRGVIEGTGTKSAEFIETGVLDEHATQIE
jgi:hypothetical protein